MSIIETELNLGNNISVTLSKGDKFKDLIASVMALFRSSDGMFDYCNNNEISYYSNYGNTNTEIGITDYKNGKTSLTMYIFYTTEENIINTELGIPICIDSSYNLRNDMNVYVFSAVISNDYTNFMICSEQNKLMIFSDDLNTLSTELNFRIKGVTGSVNSICICDRPLHKINGVIPSIKGIADGVQNVNICDNNCIGFRKPMSGPFNSTVINDKNLMSYKYIKHSSLYTGGDSDELIVHNGVTADWKTETGMMKYSIQNNTYSSYNLTDITSVTLSLDVCRPIVYNGYVYTFKIGYVVDNGYQPYIDKTDTAGNLISKISLKDKFKYGISILNGTYDFILDKAAMNYDYFVGNIESWYIYNGIIYISNGTYSYSIDTSTDIVTTLSDRTPVCFMYDDTNYVVYKDTVYYKCTDPYNPLTTFSRILNGFYYKTANKLLFINKNIMEAFMVDKIHNDIIMYGKFGKDITLESTDIVNAGIILKIGDVL